MKTKILIILIILIGLGIGGFFIYRNIFVSEEKGEKATKPYIKVFSPNGGEEWIKGKSYSIQWSQRELERWGNIATICLVGSDIEENIILTKEVEDNAICAYELGSIKGSHLIAETTLTEDLYQWTISEEIFGIFEEMPEFYKIKIYVFDKLSAEGRTEWAGIIKKDESDNYFSITE